MLRRRILLLPMVFAALAATARPAAAQVDPARPDSSASEPAVPRAPASDICPLGARLGAGRASDACIRLRSSLQPVLDAGGTEPPTLFGISPLPFRLGANTRSAYPLDRDDGAMWGGRGLSASVTAGATTRVGPVTIALSPVLTFSENRRFELPTRRPPEGPVGAYPWAEGGLDWPIRPGSESLGGIEVGDSWLEADFGAWRTGVSTERLRWGPARRYPLLFGGSGPGFAHAYASTGAPLRTYAGDFTGELLWGRVTESAWFDARASNDHRLLGAFRVGWSYPEVVPGLELAFSVVRHEPLDGDELGVSRIFQLFTGDPADEDPARDGLSMGTLAFRWAFPDEGAEVYGEIGRGEGFLNPVPGVSDTRLALVYMLGISKASLDADGAGWRFSGEVVRQSMELPQPSGRAADLPHGLRAGHTHRGTLLGAWIGPGSNAQFIAVDRLGPARSWGIFAERVRRDDDTYWREFAARYGFRGHDVEWTLGARAGGWLYAPVVERITGPIALSFEGGVSRRKNRNFVGLDEGSWLFVREWNLWGELRATIDLNWRERR